MSDTSKRSARFKASVRPTLFSRREALKRMGVTVGTGMMATLSLMSACKNASQTTIPTTPATTPTTSTTAPTTPTTPTTIPTTSTTSPTSSTTTPPNTTGFVYTPPAEPAPVVDVPNSSCKVATDRLYSLEHVWVKKAETDVAILGLTTSLIAILFEPYKLEFPKVGTKFTKDDGIGEVEGYKVSADLIAPISGEVLQVNTFLEAFAGTALIEPLNDDPYNSGWLIAVKLTNPGELDSLLTPSQYLERLGKLESSPA